MQQNITIFETINYGLGILIFLALMYHAWCWGMVGCSLMGSVETEIREQWAARQWMAVAVTIALAWAEMSVPASFCALLVVIIYCGRYAVKKRDKKRAWLKKQAELNIRH